MEEARGWGKRRSLIDERKQGSIVWGLGLVSCSRCLMGGKSSIDEDLESRVGSLGV